MTAPFPCLPRPLAQHSAGETGHSAAWRLARLAALLGGADHLVEEMYAAVDDDGVRDPGRLALTLLGMLRQARRTDPRRA